MIRLTNVLASSTLVLLAASSGPASALDPCPGPVTVRRAHSDESAELRLVRCDGSPNLESLDELSMLGRPTGTPRPSAEALAVFQAHAPEARRARFVSPGVHRLDPGLLPRLQALADEFGGKPLAIVSGYRPHARRGSRHRVGRALDVQVEGVPRRAVALFARSLPETGVGYYPNSSFTHIDVREESYHWVDRSGPGEAPQYVAWGDALEEAAADPAPETGERDEPAEVEPVMAAAEAAPADEETAASAPRVSTEPTPAVAAAPGAEPATTVAAASPSGRAERASETHAIDGAPVAAAERAGAPAALDDRGHPLDLATTSAQARDAIRAHREAGLFEPLTIASDDEVDWSLPWW